LGHHGELLFESALASTEFRVEQRKVRKVDGREWNETEHDMDFLISNQSVRYGVEIKNQLSYIDQTEFQIKLKMCKFLGVRPFFCVRMMPSNYFSEIIEGGGFCLVTENQNYPVLAAALAKRVRDQLGLPVAVIERMPDSAMRRFEKWHARTV
jgi:hypothetical protein